VTRPLIATLLLKVYLYCCSIICSSAVKIDLGFTVKLPSVAQVKVFWSDVSFAFSIEKPFSNPTEASATSPGAATV
jgi:hypothetical protein